MSAGFAYFCIRDTAKSVVFTVSLTNGLDYRCSLELLVLVQRSLQAQISINWLSLGMTYFVATVLIQLNPMSRSSASNASLTF
jgi:hypothetical protein